MQQELDEQRTQMERHQQEMTHASAAREQELSIRLKEFETLRRQLEVDRDDLARQRELTEASRRSLLQEHQQLESTRQQLHEARRGLAEASIAQTPDRFSAEALTLLANEFNTPLASVKALLTTLLEGDHGEIPPTISEALRDIEHTNARLCRVVSDALDVALLEHGQLPVSIKDVSLQDILSRAEQESRKTCDEKRLSLTREGDDSSVIAADPEHVHRILTALLRNAAQYTEHGGITISCSAQPDRATITISDTGIGIQPGQLGQLFAKPKLGTLLHGKGLSLYLARNLAKLMGGDVMLISSELERGSTFVITLPRQAKPAAPASAASAASTASAEVTAASGA
jgi:signal transduction histidine kinase